jgi:hypothetical protein
MAYKNGFAEPRIRNSQTPGGRQGSHVAAAASRTLRVEQQQLVAKAADRLVEAVGAGGGSQSLREESSRFSAERSAFATQG